MYLCDCESCGCLIQMDTDKFNAADDRRCDECRIDERELSWFEREQNYLSTENEEDQRNGGCKK